MTPHKRVRQSKFAPQRPDLVLEKLAQGFHELHVHALGQATALWWLLIVTDGPPVNDTLSITSG